MSFASASATPLSHTEAKLYIDGTLVENVTIPTTVAEIKPYTFYSCVTLEKVQINHTLTDIGVYAFATSRNHYNLSSTIIEYLGDPFNLDFNKEGVKEFAKLVEWVVLPKTQYQWFIENRTSGSSVSKYTQVFVPGPDSENWLNEGGSLKSNSSEGVNYSFPKL